MISRLELAAGRCLIALLFAAGAVQKAADPEASQALLAAAGFWSWLVWPAMIFNAAAAFLIAANRNVRPIGLSLAAYCIVTSVFHFVPSDPWQLSIMVKNWAIAGGCLILAASASCKADGGKAPPPDAAYGGPTPGMTGRTVRETNGDSAAEDHSAHACCRPCSIAARSSSASARALRSCSCAVRASPSAR